MRCRHTVPDWHRQVAAGEVTRPIFAACRLLVKETERAADPQKIACAYWGRQRECPSYEGPDSSSGERVRSRDAAVAGAPVTPDAVWPVRRSGGADGRRILLMALGGLSVVLLGGLVAISVAALLGLRLRTD